MGASTVAAQVLCIFILMFMGYFLQKCHVFGERTSNDLIAVLVLLVGPCLIIKSFMKPFSINEAHALLISTLVNVAYFLVLIILSVVLFNKRFIKDSLVRAETQFAFVYSNNGFIGLPLLMAVFGEPAVFFAAAQLSVSSLFIWTHGIYIHRRLNPHIRGRAQAASCANLVALAVGLLIYLLSIPFPKILATSIGYVADLNTPLSMFVVGAGFVGLGVSTVFDNLLAYLMTMMRLVVVPICGLAIFLWWQPAYLPNLAIVVIIVMMGCPFPAMCIMFPKLFKLDVSYATTLVALSTLLSVVTLPVMVMLAVHYFPVAL